MGAGKITTGSECGVRRACAGVVAAGRMLLQEGQRKKYPRATGCVIDVKDQTKFQKYGVGDASVGVTGSDLP